jgi:hypothetical protein
VRRGIRIDTLAKIVVALSILVAVGGVVRLRGAIVHPAVVPLNVLSVFRPSGWMGDGADTVRHVIAWIDTPSADCAGCVKVVYTPEAHPSAHSRGWAGMCLQWPDSNWGRFPGKDLRAYRRLSFSARADSLGAVIFGAGGLDNAHSSDKLPYRDTFQAAIGPVLVSPEWKHFTIELAGNDLRNVDCGFSWSAAQASNAHGVTFYLKDIEYGQ